MNTPSEQRRRHRHVGSSLRKVAEKTVVKTRRVVVPA